MSTFRNVFYQTHTAYEGWGTVVKNAALAGNYGSICAIQALKCWTDDPQLQIYASVYYPAEGWQEAVSFGEVAGVTGKCKNIYGVRIYLQQGVATQHVHIVYRVCANGLSWSTWKSDGEPLCSDTTPLTGLQIQLVDGDDWREAVSDVNGTDAYFLSSLDYILGNAHQHYVKTAIQPRTEFGHDAANLGYFSQCTELDTLARKHGTDKSSERHNYANKYDFFFSPIRTKR